MASMKELVESRIAIRLGQCFSNGQIVSFHQIQQQLSPEFDLEVIKNCLSNLVAVHLLRKKECDNLHLYWTVESESWSYPVINKIRGIRTCLSDLKPLKRVNTIDLQIQEKLDADIERIESEINKLEERSVSSHDLNPDATSPSEHLIPYTSEQLMTIKKLQTEMIAIDQENSKWMHCAKQCLGLLTDSYQCTQQDLLRHLQVKRSILSLL